MQARRPTPGHPLPAQDRRAINPAQADLRLDPQTITAWRERLAVTTDGKPRREVHSILFAIRGLYRDLAEWSHEEPARWGVWVVPCPVPRSESRASSKEKRHRRARMQSRTRALTPLLPALVAEADGRKEWAARLLAAAKSAEDAQTFEVEGVIYRRRARPGRTRYEVHSHVWAELLEAPSGARPIRLFNGLVNVTQVEADAFWGWAIIETLRHTGIRIEELLELTQLSLRHYTSQSTGTVVPLLHITPSKTDRERLIPMSPELVKVLLSVQRRAKAGRSQIPVSIRYDPHERVHGAPFPHLFSRRVGARQEVISHHYVRGALNQLAASAGLEDGGRPVTFTPHDFRRLFTTEMVGSGLPLHIVASLLGHLDLERGPRSNRRKSNEYRPDLRLCGFSGRLLISSTTVRHGSGVL
jgi:integrase